MIHTLEDIGALAQGLGGLVLIAFVAFFTVTSLIGCAILAGKAVQNLLKGEGIGW